MMRSLVWVSGDLNGWACSNCGWRFPVPTLMSGEDAKAAYDRLAAAKFREHLCEGAAGIPAPKHDAKQNPVTAFADRARTLIKQGYTLKVAVDLVLHEMETEHGHDPWTMEKVRADAEDFLRKAHRGLI
jgi:hypothetical protein